MANLIVKNICKRFDKKGILNDISFDVKTGEFLSILGPSGCGKTTLLKILIGIEKNDSGNIFVDDVDVTNLKPSERKMGIVFQNYALFPNMTVLENISYVLKNKYKDKKKSVSEAIEMLEIVNMSEYKNKYPHQLSGGQQQRVAIARTLVMNPEIILFDEPMSALDANNRIILRKEIKNIQKKFKTTMIYITHDQEEAFSMSDRVLVMNNGKIEQIDTPNKIFNNPANEYVEKFVKEHLIEKVSSIEKCTKVDL